MRNRLIVIGGVMSLFLLLAVGKLADVQLVNPDRFRSTGAEQRIVSVKLQSARGAILDRKGQDLVLSVPRSTVIADPAQVSDVKAEAAVLARILEMPRAELEELLTQKSRFVYLARLVSDDTADAISAACEAGDLDGIDLIEEFDRVRPGGTEARSILGLTDVDGVGISGLEAQYDDLLSGTPGEIVYEQSSLGAIAGGQRKVVASTPGDDVVLSIDQQLQFETERLVAAQVERTGSKGGIAIITKPSTGEILAMANMVVDPESEKVVPSSNNQALTTVFEPGSVNKVITVAAALAEGQVTPSTVLDVPDYLTLGEANFGEAHDLPNRMTVTDILTVSSNIGTIELAKGLGDHTLDAYLRSFGFGSMTGLDFPNESPGLLLDPDDWSGSSIGSIPIGQGISVTPMQMLSVYNTIANDGRYVAPKLVTATIDSQGVQLPTATPEPRRVIPTDVARQVRGMLANVVSAGTGSNAAVPGYQVAGKTGTARKPLAEHVEGDGYLGLDGHYHYVSTFVGMVPAGDPQLSIIVILDEPDPSISYYASDTSAPLFGDLARTALRLLHIPPAATVDATDGLPQVTEDLLEKASAERAVGPGAAPSTTVRPSDESATADASTTTTSTP